MNNLFDRANDFIRSSESSLVNLLSAVAPWGAPLAPAYMAFAGMREHLAYPELVAGVVAFVIEILGLATVHTTLLFWRHNRRYSREYKRMPTLLAGGMFLFYLVIVLTVNVVLEWPAQNIYTPIAARALLSLLSVPAAVTMAIRAQHTELLHEIRESQDARKGRVKGAHAESDAAHDARIPEPHAHECAHCLETFKSQQALAAHIRWSHANGRKAA